MNLKIVTYPNKILRKECKRVENASSKEIKDFVKEMKNVLEKHDGLGLAAPQVGKNLKICLAKVDDELLVLINPKIKKLSGKKIVMEEGCISFPGEFYQIERFEKIKVQAEDLEGNKQIIRARKLLARVLQHELDHLEGTLFIDRIEK